MESRVEVLVPGLELVVRLGHGVEKACDVLAHEASFPGAARSSLDCRTSPRRSVGRARAAANFENVERSAMTARTGWAIDGVPGPARRPVALVEASGNRPGTVGRLL